MSRRESPGTNDARVCSWIQKGRSANVLRIERDDLEARRVVLTVQGRIVREWADVLERECVELMQSGLVVVLDLSGVVFIGRSGIEVLGRLARAGVGIIDCSPLIADVLEQEGIEVGRSFRDPNNGTEPGKLGGAGDPSD
jgi:anti-anti-sigma regulatory factor